MEKTQVNNLFENKAKNKSYESKRTYDVRITLNKSGKGDGFSIRFGFLNNAAKAFGESQYIQISNVEKLQDAIFFRTHNEKMFLDAYKLSSNSKSRTSNCYTAFTPSVSQEKIYRLKWVNKTFNIQFDDECGLYFIKLKED